jgi:leucyl-tRNA synthetase
MAVPAHDARDHSFARTFDLPIVPVIDPDEAWDFGETAFEGDNGTMIGSPPIDGLRVDDAFQQSIRWIEENGFGLRSVSYHLRDWIFSRQHYWGEPIPLICCESCGWVPVRESELPVTLPDVENYQPTDTGRSPLATETDWVKTTCPTCGGPAQRETDTMPNWAGSNWYYLRFCDPDNPNRIADMEKLRYWLPVDVYIGGDEHNTLHLLYSRFIYLFLHDIGVVPAEYPEPFRVRLSHGVILAPDGRRMSKSRNNEVVPDEYVRQYGADTLRMYLMFMGPFDATLSWNDSALRGISRFLARLRRLIAAGIEGPATASARIAVNKAVRKVTEDIESFRYNTAIAALMELVNELSDLAHVGDDRADGGGSEIREGQPSGSASLRDLCCLLAPFAPNAADEAWHELRLRPTEASTGSSESVHDLPWPRHDATMGDQSPVTISVQVNGKHRATLEVAPEMSQEQVEALARTAGTVPTHICDKTIRRVVHVPGKAINFVV